MQSLRYIDFEKGRAIIFIYVIILFKFEFFCSFLIVLIYFY